MSILMLPIFISILFVTAAILFFFFLNSKREFEYSDEIALIPLEDDCDKLSKRISQKP